jgi:hypothetical protein
MCMYVHSSMLRVCTGTAYMMVRSHSDGMYMTLKKLYVGHVRS